MDCDERDTQRRYALFFCFKFQVFWNTDWRNWSNLKNTFYSIVTLSELVLSFVEMKANENVLHRAARRFLALDCDERDTQRRYALFFCFKFYSHDCHPERSRRLMEIVFAQRFTEIS